MDLFGRKERIEELEQALDEQEQSYEKQIEELEHRLEKEKDRSREASAAKQDAEETINRLEDRIRSLEDRIDEDDRSVESHRQRQKIDATQMDELLTNLASMSYGSSKATTVYNTIAESITDSDTGEILLSSPYFLQNALIPPVPIQDHESYRSDGFAIGPVREMIEDRYCLFHLTAGGSGAAIIEEGEVEASIIVDADIKAQHTKGGYSQSRFERRREEMIEEHIEEFMEEARQILEKGFSHLFVAGSDDIVAEVTGAIEHDHTPFRSRVSRIEDGKDLERSFRTGFTFDLVRLTDDERGSIEDFL